MENFYGFESEKRSSCKSGVPSNARANAISPLPADKGQDSDFLQDPLGKSTVIPRWRRLRGEIMRRDGLK